MMVLRTTLVWACLLAVSQAEQHVVVVLDDSGSMADFMRSDADVRKIDAAQRGLRAVLEQVPGDAEVGVVSLNAGGAGDHWIIPLGPVDRARLEETTARIRASGGTPLGQYMKVGADVLLDRRASQPFGEYRLLIVTDGEANDADLVDAYLPDIRARGIVVDVIGVDMQSDHSLATRVDSYRRADDPSSLQRAIAAALAESDEADTSTDAAGESDFELLADFPADVAPVVLAALTRVDNTPIVGRDDGDNAASGRWARTPGAAPVGGKGGFGFFLGLTCVGISVVVLLGVVTLLKAVTRN